MGKIRTIYARTTYVDEDGVVINKSELKGRIYKVLHREREQSKGMNGDRIINTLSIIKIFEEKQLNLFES